MEEAIFQYITKNFPEILQRKSLVAVSGGLDSILLAFLLKRMGAEMVLAHCNFQLRGEESQGDEAFVREFAQNYEIPVEVIRFQTKKYAQENGLNTQLAARKLRYEWFEELRQSVGAEQIITAHHADDSLETFLMNLSRGAGLHGLLSIPPRNGKILRPMLIFSRQEILQEAQRHSLHWREDSSNASDAYLRNRIRHHISPELRQTHPSFLQNFLRTLENLQQSAGFIASELEKIRTQVFLPKGEELHFQVEILKNHPHRNFLLFELLSPFGFKNLPDLQRLLSATSGKQLFSPTHRLVTDRKKWIITPLQSFDNQLYMISQEDESITTPLGMRFQMVSQALKNDAKNIYVSAEKLHYPLQLRKRRQGDIFFPQGMQGQKKTLSKFFKDEKYSVLQKERQWILTDAQNRVIWVVGRRADARFLPEKSSAKILKISLLES